VPVREDGTIALPLIDPVKVTGLSIAEAQVEIVKAYTVTRKILQPGRERVIISLMQPRQYHVLVAREDGGAVETASTGGFGGYSGGTSITETRRSIGVSLDLPAYENDLLNALMRTGGVPGFEAEDYVIIQRGTGYPGQHGGLGCRPPEAIPPGGRDQQTEVGAGRTQPPRIIRVPLRIRVGEQPNIRPSDIILQNGDIVSVRVRRGEVFYTGGLLPPRVFPLPRERDLDILEALVLVGAPIINGGLGVNNLSGNVVSSGLGSPSPSLVSIVRKTTGGGEIIIRVSLNRALRDPRERVRILPGDMIVLQETMLETFSRYTSGVLSFGFFGTTVRQRDLTGSATLTVP
jgi:hypothetical protein